MAKENNQKNKVDKNQKIFQKYKKIKNSISIEFHMLLY